MFLMPTGRLSRLLKVAPRVAAVVFMMMTMEEAKSIRHMLTHVPKNPYCDICTKAKMFKPPSRAVGGSTKVKAEKIGDHITADFIVTRDEDELGIDEEKSALVVKELVLCMSTPMREEPPMLLFWLLSILLDTMKRLESSTATMLRS